MLRLRWKLLGAGLACALFVFTDWPLQAELGVLRAYQRWGSPVVGMVATCRYRETCSLYAVRQLEERGFWTGNLRIGVRLLMCSPIGAAVDYLRHGSVTPVEVRAGTVGWTQWTGWTGWTVRRVGASC